MDDIASRFSFKYWWGDLGNTLSVGQPQRPMLANALYRNPKLLFFDDATRHLDSAMKTKLALPVLRLGSHVS